MLHSWICITEYDSSGYRVVSDRADFGLESHGDLYDDAYSRHSSRHSTLGFRTYSLVLCENRQSFYYLHLFGQLYMSFDIFLVVDRATVI